MAKKKSTKEAWVDSALEDWGSYMSAKKAKLEEQFHELADNEFTNPTKLLNGIAIFVNGWTNPTSGELRRLMMEHGGIYHHYLRSSTTHIIASNLPHSKIVQYRKSKHPLPLVKPEWITDSIKASKLLDWRPYLLYSSATNEQPKLQFTKENPPKTSTDVSEQSNHHENMKKINENSLINSKQVEKKNIQAISSKNEEFISEFYNNSRLHHISTMGATFKEYVNELRSKNNGSFIGFDNLKNSYSSRVKKKENGYDSDEDLFASDESDDETLPETIIMHIDMDCFFVSVGLRNRQDLIGKPVAVTHSKGGNKLNDTTSMSEIASCSYEARKFGLKNGMLLGNALKLCPNLTTIKYDFEGYKEVSYCLYNTVASYTLDIEAVSCDEMYADVTSIISNLKISINEFSNVIRNEIKNKTGCPVSTGFGCNKLQARLATKKAKPDGYYYLKNSHVKVFMENIFVNDIPGVGSSMMLQLQKMNIKNCKDLQSLTMNVLQKEFGKKTGEMLYNTCRGIDNSKLNIEHVRKSVSAEVNYGIRFDDDNDAKKFLIKLTNEVCNRLKKINAKGKSLTLKLMVRSKDAPVDPAKFMGHGRCDNYTKSKSYMTAIDDVEIITKDVLNIWEQMKQNSADIRGIGIQISRLEIVNNHTTDMMKFIARGNLKNNEGLNQAGNNSDGVLLNNNDNKKIQVNLSKKKQHVEAAKTNGIKSFFTAVKSIAEKPKASHSDYLSNIDETVLAELPEDIRNEILESRKAAVVKDKVEKKFNDSQIAGTSKQSDVIDSKNISADKNSVRKRFNDSQVAGPSRQINPVDSKNISTDKNSVKKKFHDSQIAGPSRQIDPVDNKNISNVKNQMKYKINTSQEATTSRAVDKKIIDEEIDDEVIPSSQAIDESVFEKLPDDIRHEILANKPVIKKKKKPTEKSVDEYYKNKKSGSFVKPKLQDIDMGVLIELPDDIRNEILNEYKKNDVEIENKEKQNLDNNIIIKDKRIDRIKKSNFNSSNVSFSQVDEDYLAALDKDTRADVRMYCIAKKNEKELLKSKNNDNEINQSNKKPAGKLINKKKKKILYPKIVKRQDSQSFLEQSIVNDDHAKEVDRRDAIRFHQMLIRGEQDPVDDHNQEILITLVNHLFSLPLQQVKKQIQTWIQNTVCVNEIDLLSIATFLSMLPQEKRLEDLHVIMKTMHRCMLGTGNCVWHNTYKKIIEHVQLHMQVEYNYKLMISSSIKCDNSECDSQIS
ncbi:hypothetical protein HCN44_003934 [Aphidius gifuensis]|uniref:DNA repair protein REV1 n=1 Tax=Aphidius gifuensis TaxID=684658 RepID=A0A834XZF6_APHGI|nr:DNA repair protein REV1 [Aphidius gifuensis]KAF7994462.1 hypothetical protein HCN44_003934 [Aphidius gifuensis]